VVRKRKRSQGVRAGYVWLGCALGFQVLGLVVGAILAADGETTAAFGIVIATSGLAYALLAAAWNMGSGDLADARGELTDKRLELIDTRLDAVYAVLHQQLEEQRETNRLL